jgi:hypothetical protein
MNTKHFKKKKTLKVSTDLKKNNNNKKKKKKKAKLSSGFDRYNETHHFLIIHTSISI